MLLLSLTPISPLYRLLLPVRTATQEGVRVVRLLHRPRDTHVGPTGTNPHPAQTDHRRGS